MSNFVCVIRSYDLEGANAVSNAVSNAGPIVRRINNGHFLCPSNREISALNNREHHIPRHTVSLVCACDRSCIIECRNPRDHLHAIQRFNEDHNQFRVVEEDSDDELVDDDDIIDDYDYNYDSASYSGSDSASDSDDDGNNSDSDPDSEGYDNNSDFYYSDE